MVPFISFLFHYLAYLLVVATTNYTIEQGNAMVNTFPRLLTCVLFIIINEIYHSCEKSQQES